MKKHLSALLGVALLLGAFSTVNADVKMGQKAYLKKCKKCHGNGTKGAAMKTQKEWADSFADGAAQFKSWHKDDKKAMDYLNSSRFEKDAPNLKDFLYNYGSDSGNVPSCG